MHATRLTLLNASILTTYGTFRYEALSLKQARELIREFKSSNTVIQSAIGHQATADLLTTLLEFPVPANRVEFTQSVEDAALIFRLRRRPAEGKILSREEMEEVGYELGLLTRIA